MPTHAGDLLREWRQRRRLSQLDLAIAANVSSRHLSFVETGRARPSSDMIRQAEATGDARLAALHTELAAYPGGRSHPPRPADVVIPLRYRADHEELSFISITAMVGTPMDVTVEELAIESFYPADETTAAWLAP